MSAFPLLFSPFSIGGLEIRNRIFSTGHQTLIQTGGLPNEGLAAYHEARARGGTGLIITEAMCVHESAYFNEAMIFGYRDEAQPGLRSITEAVHRHGGRVFGQLFHPGAEVLGSDPYGTRTITWAPSSLNHERYFGTTRELPDDLIVDIIEGYGLTAERMVEAGYDGVEIVASHGYLPAQFLSPMVNLRSDRWGGSRENRQRFLLEVARTVRARVPAGTVLGLRISLDEKDHIGLKPDEALAALAALEDEGLVDYMNIAYGSSASSGGARHIAPPMMIEAGYMKEAGATVKRAMKTPILLAGRFNQPQLAEAALASGAADMIGMTRAQIADPEMANKAREGRIDDIRACIACNQACIGHVSLGTPISCIQHPETGRELTYGTRVPAQKPLRVIVAGGGPAGMKAAAVAAERGHKVSLCEAAPRLGGQTLLAQQLPGRAEFGGIVTNLAREMELAGVEVRLSTPVTAELAAGEGADAVVVATGAQPFVPVVEGSEEGHVVTAWQVINREVNCGGSVVVADWRGDWFGVGIAQMLALEGRRVRFMTSAHCAGINLQPYVRDMIVAELMRLGVTITTYARLAGVDADTAYFEQTTSGEAILAEDTETVVLALGHRSEDSLKDALKAAGIATHVIGDALAPRTCEEAVLDGLKAGTVL
jgi:2,4-dienoyl-CoA reductase-like NADH-dependent reductase (Old Yellow Enzyme family)/thioredoxin reductase